MNRRRNIATLLIIGLAVIVVTPQASAHVLVTDKASHSSAVLHITPDDDPEAGKPASFYYALQTAVSYTTFDEYRLHITDDAGQTKLVPVEATNNSISAVYTFPTQGLYKLELKSVNPWKTSFDLRYSLRVSRGVVGSAEAAEKYSWTKPVLVSVGVLALLLIILFINNYRSIREHSAFPAGRN